MCIDTIGIGNYLICVLIIIDFIHVCGDPNVKTNYRFSFGWEECVENLDLLEIWVRWEREEGKLFAIASRLELQGVCLGILLLGLSL